MRFIGYDPLKIKKSNEICFREDKSNYKINLTKPFYMMNDFFELIKDIWEFLKVRKKYWLAPLIITVVVIGSLIIFTQGSVVAPFIYSIF